MTEQPDAKNPNAEPVRRAPYESPRIIASTVFETLAMSCLKQEPDGLNPCPMNSLTNS
jgi:hypothetical protein